jgi:uncharacterized membrane protein YqjE
MADGNRLNDESASELVRKLAEQTSTLVRQELAIARAELSEKVKFWGLGGGLFGVAALLALFALIVLIATAILALAEAVAPWLAALIVAVVLLLIAGVLGLVGKQQVERAAPVVPERAREGVQRDVETVRERGGR